MFDIGWTEVVVIVIIAGLLLDSKDIPSIVKNIRILIKKYRNFTIEIKEAIEAINQETKSITKKVKDLEGNEQEAYDLDDITPDLTKNKDDQYK